MSPRPRRAKAAPAVLFQPPDPEHPLPRQPLRSSPAPSVPPAADPASLSPDAPPADQAGRPRNTTTDDQADPLEEAPAHDQVSPPRNTSAKGQASPPESALVRDQAGPPETAPVRDQAGPSGGGPAAGVDQPGRKRTTPVRKAAPSKKAASAKKALPAKKATPTQRATPVRQTAPTNEATPAGQAVPNDEVTSARKVTRAKKAAPATKRAAAPRRNATPAEVTSAPQPSTPQPSTPQPSTATATAADDPVTALGRTPESDVRAVVARLRNHPGFAPELLALEAVRTLGPGAAEWAARLRARYPDAPADGLARLATRRYVRAAGAGGAAAALAGLFAPLAELASVLWTQANLVLRLAAAYGQDPAHPDRAAELLVLTQVHPDTASAQEALAATKTAGDPVEGTWPRAAEAAWRLAAPLTAQAGGWVALRLASRLLPGAAVVAATLGDAAAADRLAARAVAAYRPGRR
ncbi:hypothetical protein [Micromonospora lupini]|uniref:hypothetical protein n=1 Tax=Micromonospora lupini TaxID=285679 RepID=UPI001ED9A1E1|nr:hypothetical protein [Micromonospora lupini]